MSSLTSLLAAIYFFHLKKKLRIATIRDLYSIQKHVKISTNAMHRNKM